MIEGKEIILGECIVTENEKWECNDCYHRWGYNENQF